MTYHPLDYSDYSDSIDDMTPRERGYKILASGNYAIVESNGDVSNILSPEAWLEENNDIDYDYYDCMWNAACRKAQ